MDACCMLQLIKCRVQCPRHTLVWSKEYININTTHHILWPGLRDPITFLVSLYHHVLHTRPRNAKKLHAIQRSAYKTAAANKREQSVVCKLPNIHCTQLIMRAH